MRAVRRPIWAIRSLPPPTARWSEVVDDEGGETTGFGNRVVLRHDLPEPIQWNGQTVTHVHSLYAHLQSVTSIDPGRRSRSGTRSPSGRQIGTLGSSGYGPDPHLHFEITLNDTLPTDDDGYNPAARRRTGRTRRTSSRRTGRRPALATRCCCRPSTTRR